jgi:hypothetical protein
VNLAFRQAQRTLLVVAAIAFLCALSPVKAQEALVASVTTTEPNSEIAPEQAVDLTSEVNPPLPVASTDPSVQNAPTTNPDMGVPRRFHYHFQLSVRSVYDDNINLNRTNEISDFYFTIEPALMLGFGDTEGRSENYLRFDYLPAVFLFADHSENNSVQHVIHLEGQYRASRLTLNLSQTIQLMDGVDVQTQNTSGSLDQQVNLDVAGRTAYDIYNTHFNAAYYVTGKTFLSAGVDYTNNHYTDLISSQTITGNFFVNYNYSPKVVVGLGGTFGYEEVDEPNPDQNFEQANLRVSYQATGKLDFAGSVGVEFRHFEGDMVDTHVSPIFEIGVNYTPFDGTKISLTANQHIYNSAVLAEQNYTMLNISGGIQQRLLQRVFLGFNGGYEKSDYFSTTGNAAPSRNDDYFFVEPSIAVSITRFWTVGAYYLHRVNDSSFDAFGFHDNQVGIRSTLQF